MLNQVLRACSDYSLQILELMLIATWRSLPLLAAAVFTAMFLRHRVNSRIQALLWFLVCVRMVLPFSVASIASWNRSIDFSIAWLAGLPNDAAAETVLVKPVKTSASELRIDFFPSNKVTADSNRPRKLSDLNYGPDDGSWGQSIRPLSIGDVAVLVAGCVWAFVSFAMILRLVVSNIRFSRMLRTCPSLTDDAVRAVVLDECDRLGLRRPDIREVSELACPAAFGLFRPCICLPVGAVRNLSPIELRLAIRHELVHIRSLDSWLLTVSQIVRAIHWINPLAWIVVSRLRSAVEVAADERTLSIRDSDEIVLYCKLLLKYAVSGSAVRRSVVGLVSMSASRRLKQRIDRIVNFSAPSSVFRNRLAFAGLLVLALAGLTDSPALTAQIIQVDQPPALYMVDLSRQQNEFDSREVRTQRIYNIKTVLDRIREVRPQENAELFLLEALAGSTTTTDPPVISDFQLSAKLDASEHIELERMLKSWERTGPRQVAIEVRVLSAESRFGSAIQWQTSLLTAAGSDTGVLLPPPSAALTTGTEMSKFARAALGAPTSNMMLAPRIILFNGQTAILSEGQTGSFVAGIQPGPDGRVTPAVESLFSGLRFRISPETNSDESIDLKVQVSVSTLRGFLNAQIPIPDGHLRQSQELQSRFRLVQVPDIVSASAETAVRLPFGDTLLITVPQTTPSGNSETIPRSYFFAFTPRLVTGRPD